MSFQRRFLVGVLVVIFGVGVGVAVAQTDTSNDSGLKMPKRWGIGVTYYDQKQPYGIESLSIPGFDPSIAKSIDVDNKTTTAHATFDYWLFPFLDVQVLAGNIESDTDVKLSKVNIGMPLANLKVKSKGQVYGAGFTLVYGNEKVFGMLTGQYTTTKLDKMGSSVKAIVFTPKIGMRVGQKAAVYAGAMYQKPSEKHSGTYAIPFVGTLPYSVKLTSADKWGYLAGLNYGFTANWVLTVEGGFGKRKSLLAHLDYRF